MQVHERGRRRTLVRNLSGYLELPVAGRGRLLDFRLLIACIRALRRNLVSGNRARGRLREPIVDALAAGAGIGVLDALLVGVARGDLVTVRVRPSADHDGVAVFSEEVTALVRGMDARIRRANDVLALDEAGSVRLVEVGERRFVLRAAHPQDKRLTRLDDDIGILAAVIDSQVLIRGAEHLSRAHASLVAVVVHVVFEVDGVVGVVVHLHVGVLPLAGGIGDHFRHKQRRHLVRSRLVRSSLALSRVARIALGGRRRLCGTACRVVSGFVGECRRHRYRKRRSERCGDHGVEASFHTSAFLLFRMVIRVRAHCGHN